MHQFESVFLSMRQYGSTKVHFICVIGSLKMFKISFGSSGYIQVTSTQRGKKSFFLLNNKRLECKEIMCSGLISLSSDEKHMVFSDTESDSQVQQISPKEHLYIILFCLPGTYFYMISVFTS